MLPQLLCAALLSAALDPVEVATRHERAGRPELALHLLDALTQGRGDAPAQAVRARLQTKLGHTAPSVPSLAPVTPSAASPPPRPSPAVVAVAIPHEDPLPLFGAKLYMRAAPHFRAALEANPHDFSAFSYLTNCYWFEAERLVQDGQQVAARKVYDEGLRLEQMYAPGFKDELTGSTAPEGLARRVGR